MHTLLKGLEKIAASADIPMLVCGDFNSNPGRFDYFYFCIILETCVRHGSFVSISKLFLMVIFSLCCSAPHALLAMGKVDPSHPDLAIDPLSILRPHSKLVHQLPLVMYCSH